MLQQQNSPCLKDDTLAFFCSISRFNFDVTEKLSGPLTCQISFPNVLSKLAAIFDTPNLLTTQFKNSTNNYLLSSTN